jgi:hypothetical protein
MPQRTPSPSEWNRVIRSIENAQHLLLAIPREPELDASILAQVDELKQAARLLGYVHGVDPFPEPISD